MTSLCTQKGPALSTAQSTQHSSQLLSKLAKSTVTQRHHRQYHGSALHLTDGCWPSQYAAPCQQQPPCRQQQQEQSVQIYQQQYHPQQQQQQYQQQYHPQQQQQQYHPQEQQLLRLQQQRWSAHPQQQHQAGPACRSITQSYQGQQEPLDQQQQQQQHRPQEQQQQQLLVDRHLLRQHQHQQRPMSAHLPPANRSRAVQPEQHKHSRCRSLSKALYVSPVQARAMLVAYPALKNHDHAFLRQKLHELADFLQVDPEQLGPALSGAPKVLGFSMQQLERRLLGLTWIQPDKQLLAQLVLEAPLVLTWSSDHLRTRLTTMAALLGISTNSLAALLQQHPQLLPASGHLRRILQLLQQLFLLAAVSEQAGFGTGVVAALVAQAQHSMAQQGGIGLQQQQQGGSAAEAAAAAARPFVLKHPQLLLVEPEALQARVAEMQAKSGLPAAQVAAILITQPALLLHSPVAGQVLAPGAKRAEAVGDRGLRGGAVRQQQAGRTRKYRQL